MYVTEATDSAVTTECVPRLDVAFSLGNCISEVEEGGIVAPGIIVSYNQRCP